MTTPVLKVRNLTTRFYTDAGQVNAVSGVSFDLESGETLSVVGESGSGKSVMGMSLIDLIESPGEITEGKIWFHNPELAKELDEHDSPVDGDYVDLRAVSPAVRSSLRGTEFGVIFQDPGAAFNPSLTVGEQIAEAVECNRRLSQGESYSIRDLVIDIVSPRSSFVSERSFQEAIDLLERVDIPDPIDRASEYPHQFSGGMLQRAMVAQALAADPAVLIADEPTTGLDVTIQAEILDLLRELQSETGMSILLITHNLGVVSNVSDRTIVMYAGEFFEIGQTQDVLNTPANPYTEGLLRSVPDLDDPQTSIEPIYGNVPSLLDHEMTKGCSFADRCPEATDECIALNPPLEPRIEANDHYVACLHRETTDRPSSQPVSEENTPIPDMTSSNE